jgi:hypothetical protein
VDDFMGTGILTAWKKLERWHKGTREEFGDPYIAEWFQWLAEQLHKYRSLDASEPAYESFHDWRPQK